MGSFEPKRPKTFRIHSRPLPREKKAVLSQQGIFPRLAGGAGRSPHKKKPSREHDRPQIIIEDFAGAPRENKTEWRVFHELHRVGRTPTVANQEGGCAVALCHAHANALPDCDRRPTPTLLIMRSGRVGGSISPQCRQPASSLQDQRGEEAGLDGGFCDVQRLHWHLRKLPLELAGLPVPRD